MKYYVTYAGNTEAPWLTDSTVDVEANSKEEARNKFMGNGYKNIRNCLLIKTANELTNDYRHPMTFLWENSTVEEGKFNQCQKDTHWLQWVEKQHHPKHNIDQYNPFIPMDNFPSWKYKLAIFCCTCGLIVYKEEGESGIPNQPMVGWWIKKYENHPKTIHGQSEE